MYGQRRQPAGPWLQTQCHPVLRGQRPHQLPHTLQSQSQVYPLGALAGAQPGHLLIERDGGVIASAGAWHLALAQWQARCQLLQGVVLDARQVPHAQPQLIAHLNLRGALYIAVEQHLVHPPQLGVGRRIRARAQLLHRGDQRLPQRRRGVVCIAQP